MNRPREIDRLLFPETLEEKVGCFLLGVVAVLALAAIGWLIWEGWK